MIDGKSAYDSLTTNDNPAEICIVISRTIKRLYISHYNIIYLLKDLRT